MLAPMPAPPRTISAPVPVEVALVTVLTVTTPVLGITNGPHAAVTSKL